MSTTTIGPIIEQEPFSSKQVLCQLYSYKEDDEKNIVFELGLPAKIKPERQGEGKKPIIVDNSTRQRFHLMEVVPKTGNYQFYIGQEMRMRIRNRVISRNPIYFCLLFQDHKGCYHSIFPHFSPHVRSMTQDFKMLPYGEETVLTIPTGLLPKANEVHEEEVVLVRMVLVVTISTSLVEVVAALKKRMIAIAEDNKGELDSTDGKLVVFHYKFNMNRKKIISSNSCVDMLG